MCAVRNEIAGNSACELATKGQARGDKQDERTIDRRTIESHQIQKRTPVPPNSNGDVPGAKEPILLWKRNALSKRKLRHGVPESKVATRGVVLVVVVGRVDDPEARWLEIGGQELLRKHHKYNFVRPSLWRNKTETRYRLKNTSNNTFLICVRCRVSEDQHRGSS